MKNGDKMNKKKSIHCIASAIVETWDTEERLYRITLSAEEMARVPRLVSRLNFLDVEQDDNYNGDGISWTTEDEDKAVLCSMWIYSDDGDCISANDLVGYEKRLDPNGMNTYWHTLAKQYNVVEEDED